MKKIDAVKNINRRIFLQKIAAGSTALALGGQAFASAAKTIKKPNILYIMTDQQPISCVGIYGKNSVIKTPYLDQLARQGCVLTKSYITSFPCAPSRASLFTGRYLHNHKVIKNDMMLDPSIPSLGDICKKEGYSTGYFGKWHLGGWMNKGNKVDTYGGGQKGFTEWHFDLKETENGWKTESVKGGPGEDCPQHGFDDWAGGWAQYKDWLRDNGLGDIVNKNPRLGCHNILPPGSYETIGTSGMDQNHHVEAFIAEKTEQFIKNKAKDNKPWCAVASFYGPHPPVAPSKPWDEMYSIDQVKLPDNHRDSMQGKPSSQKSRGKYKLGQWTDDKFKDYIRRFWGFASYIDLQIGRILNAVEKTGQMDNTIIVFTSDHGNMCGEHGMIFKTLGTGYEELFRVPTIIYLPGVKNISHVDSMVSHVDLLPTLLEASQIPIPNGLDGTSILPLLKGQSTKHRDFVFADATNRSLICRDNQHKFALHWSRNQIDELYDLQKDPGEMSNLAYTEEGKRVADKMRRQIIKWLRKTHHRYADQIAKKTFDKSRGQAS